jgi:tetratricopeptide (TPR) repeat protein
VPKKSCINTQSSFTGQKNNYRIFCAYCFTFQYWLFHKFWHGVVGDYYYNRKNYDKAIDSYENVLRVDPENVHALNNLAWLFATCPIKEFQNKNKALEYSIRALKQKREAFILDTYAQACFINNDIKNAISAAQEALYLSKDKKEYYKNQLQKFENILKN